MELPKILNVTDQTVDISSLDDRQTDYYQLLSNELKNKYLDCGQRRQIFTLSGPAGSGKSVITALLEHIYKNNSDFRFVNIGLDAFHYSNEHLASEKLLEVKGRYDTYDTTLLLTKMTAFKAGEPVFLPYYSREDHNPIADKISVTEENVLLLLEGQWLLRNAPEWAELRDLYTYNLAVSASIDDLRENVIQRHIKGGRTREDAMNFYEGSDLVNTLEIEKNSIKPDKKVLFYKDI